MLEILKNTVEYKEFGFNTLTVAAIMTILFSFLQAYGIYKQGKEIWQKKSGEAIASVFFFYNFFYFFIFLIFGLMENKLAVIINGSLCFFYIPVLLGLKKYKKFSSLDRLMIILMLIASSSIFFYPRKDQLLFAFSLISLIVIIKQFREFIKERQLGAFSKKYLQMFFVTGIFWCIYFAAIGQWLLEITCVIGTILYALILILQRRWEMEERMAPLTFYVLWKARRKRN